METRLIGAVKWVKENWLTIVQVVGIAYIVLDVVIRWVIPAEKMEEYVIHRNKIKELIGKVYMALERFFTVTR
jgi:hypothetical protein